MEETSALDAFERKYGTAKEDNRLRALTSNTSAREEAKF